MICYEEGLFDLNDPVSNLIPSFTGSRLLTGGSPGRPRPSRVTSQYGSGTCSPTRLA